MDELAIMDEAPHSLRSETSSFHEMPHDDMEQIDLDDDDDDDDDQNQIINILDRTKRGQISATDLLSDDTIQCDNLMFDEHTIFNSSNGNLMKYSHHQSHQQSDEHTILDTSNISSSNTSDLSKSDKMTNSSNGAIGDVLILTNKSKQTFGINSHNA